MKQTDRDRPDRTVSTTDTNRADSLGGRLCSRSTSGSRYRRLFVLGLVVCSLAAVPVVSAHAYLVASSPEDGAQLTDAPEAVTLRFSSKVLSANITVADLAGNRVDSGSVTRINETSFRVPLDTLESGAYTVEWQIVSADGHQLTGSFTFVVVGNETSPTQTMAKTATHTTTDNRTIQTPATTPGATDRPTATATTGQAQTTDSAGAGFGLAAAVGAGIVIVVTLLVLRGWRE